MLLLSVETIHVVLNLSTASHVVPASMESQLFVDRAIKATC